MHVCCACSVAQSCLTLCSPPDSSVHGIFQARILEWVAISYSRGSSDPGTKPVSLASSPWQVDSLPLHQLRNPCIHEHMYAYTDTCVCVCIQTCEKIQYAKNSVHNNSKFPQSGDKMTNSKRNLLLEGTIFAVCFDFFLRHVRAVPAHWCPPCLSVTGVAVVPFLSHSNCWWGIHTCLQKSSDIPDFKGHSWAFKGPCGLGQVTVSTFLSESEVVRPLIFMGPFCSDSSVTPWQRTPLSCTMTG